MNGMVFLMLQIFVQFGVSFLRIWNVGRGRILSRPMYRVFRPLVTPWGTRLYTLVRMKQVAILTLWYIPQVFFFDSHWAKWVYGGVVIALYMDDYLTGDDEKWNRRKEWAKNKIKWLMRLPAPVAEGLS